MLKKQLFKSRCVFFESPDIYNMLNIFWHKCYVCRVYENHIAIYIYSIINRIVKDSVSGCLIHTKILCPASATPKKCVIQSLLKSTCQFSRYTCIVLFINTTIHSLWRCVTKIVSILYYSWIQPCTHCGNVLQRLYQWVPHAYMEYTFLDVLISHLCQNLESDASSHF
mgnify:CR=1 FL=1